MEWYYYPAVVGAGFVAGFINTLAGSGSLVTLPLLILIGLPATVANGTNRVGIFLQGLVGAYAFRRQELLDARGIALLGLPAIVGSVLGAQIAVNLDETLMRRSIGIAMILMFIVILARPQQWLQGKIERFQDGPHPKLLLLFFVIGIYGGFIQAGVGIFLLAALVVGAGYDLMRANATKVGINLLFTLAAMLVFTRNGQVDWPLGMILAIGNIFGAWVGARFAVERGTSWVRRLLMAVVAVAAVDLLGIVDFFLNLLRSSGGN